MKFIRYLSIMLSLLGSLIPLKGAQTAVTLNDVKEAAKEYVKAKDELADERKSDDSFAKTYKAYKDSLIAFSNAWKGIPDTFKANYVDLATEVSKHVEGVPEGKSSKRILLWGAKWHVRKPPKNAVPLKANFDDLAKAAKEYVSSYTLLLKAKPYMQLKEATLRFKELVIQYIQQGGSVSDLLESMQFFNNREAIKKLNRWIARGIITIPRTD